MGLTRREDNHTTFLRSVLGMIVGAITGVMFFLLWPAALIAFSRSTAVDVSPLERLEGLFIVAGFVLAYFTVGLVAVGAPAWWLFHRLGRRSWLDALFLGVVLTFVCYVVFAVLGIVWTGLGPGTLLIDTEGATLQNNRALTIQGMPIVVVLVNAFWTATAGGVVGITTWGIAYGKHAAG